jgi:hypothetical protein
MLARGGEIKLEVDAIDWGGIVFQPNMLNERRRLQRLQ